MSSHVLTADPLDNAGAPESAQPRQASPQSQTSSAPSGGSNDQHPSDVHFEETHMTFPPNNQGCWPKLEDVFPAHALDDFDNPAREFLARFAPAQPLIARQSMAAYVLERRTRRIDNPSAYIVAACISAQHRVWANKSFHRIARSVPHWGATDPPTSPPSPDGQVGKPYLPCRPGVSPPPKGSSSSVLSQTLDYAFEQAQYHGCEGLDLMNVHTLLFRASVDVSLQFEELARTHASMLRRNPSQFDGTGVGCVAFKRHFLEAIQSGEYTPGIDHITQVVQIRAALWKQIQHLIAPNNDCTSDTRRLELVCQELAFDVSTLCACAAARLALLDESAMRALVEYGTLLALGKAAAIADPSLYLLQTASLIAPVCPVLPAATHRPQCQHSLAPSAPEPGKNPVYQAVLGALLHRQIRRLGVPEQCTDKVSEMLLGQPDEHIQDMLSDARNLRARVHAAVELLAVSDSKA